MILIIDNYDSFVYNLSRYFGQLGFKRTVIRNDKLTIGDIESLKPSHIVISPGPCTPNEAGLSLDIVKHFGARIPILGICLGHQAIGQAYGGNIIKAPTPMHGKQSIIQHDNQGIFTDIPGSFNVGRYHSLIIERDSLPSDLTITASTDDGVIMAVEHKNHPVIGLQFHPESVLTEHGYALLKNFL